MEEKFRKEQIETLARLKKIDFSNENINNSFNFILRKKLIDFDTHKSLYDISQYYSSTTLQTKFENQLFSDMKTLITSHEELIKKLNKIIMHENIIQKEYNSIIDNIKSNESQIKELIDYYGDYLKENKGFIIRNEILKTFLEKILISKEDKENLANRDLFNETFFTLIEKMIVIKENIEIINQNSSSFSKTLLMSIQEHNSLIDELLNEKIVIYLKIMFRSKETLTLNSFKKICSLIGYLKQKEHYLKFVVNEYTQMKKKMVEEQLKAKYLKISNIKYDEMFKNLNEDFIFYFLKEFLLINYLFNTTTTSNDVSDSNTSTIIKLEQNDMFDYMIYIENQTNRNQDHLASLVKLQSSLIQVTELNAYILNLNTILFVFEDLFFQQIQKSESFYEVYKITLLSYYYTEQIEHIFKENHLEGISIKLSVIISNYKKNYSMLFKKIQNDTVRNLQKIKGNIINYLTDSQILITNESIIYQSITTLINDYIKIFRLFQQFTINNDDKEIVNPLQHDSYIILISFFNNEQIRNQNGLDVLFKVINLLHILVQNLKEYDAINMKKNEDLIEELINKTVNSIMSTLLSNTKFESELMKCISHEQTTELLEKLLEKAQLDLASLHYISDYSMKERIKDKIKKEIVNVYKEITMKDSVSLCFISEEELRNYLDIL